MNSSQHQDRSTKHINIYFLQVEKNTRLMSPKTSRVTVEDEDTRGCCGCFGWFFRLFKRKRRGNRAKNKDAEGEARQAQLDGAATAAEDVMEVRQAEVDGAELAKAEQESRAVKTWAEEVDEAEEKGLDVFAPPTSFLPRTAGLHCDTQANTKKEATAGGVTRSATQSRRARRNILAAALKASTEGEAASHKEATAAAQL